MCSDSCCELGSSIFLLGPTEHSTWIILESENLSNYLGISNKDLEVCILFQDCRNTIYDVSSRQNSGVKINLYFKADLSLRYRQSRGVLGVELSRHWVTVTFWNDCGCRSSCRHLLLALLNWTHFSVKHFPGCIKGVE